MNRFRFDAHELRSRAPLLLTALAAGMAGAFLMILAIRFTGLGPTLVGPPVAITAPPAGVQPQPLSFGDSERATINAVGRVSPAVVMITTNTIVADYDFFIGPEVKQFKGLGSGVIFRSDGYILTNSHVVEGMTGLATKILVVLSNGKSYSAKLIGIDPQTDLAVLKVGVLGLPVPVWGDSNQIQVGQAAIAIGNPLAENLKSTVTVGVVSARGRSIRVGNVQFRNMIQTDASINFGNSGGPLVDSSGRIIGINSALGAGQGIGFAIPSNTAKSVADQLITKGYVSRPGMGIAYIHYTPENANLLEVKIQRRLPQTNGIFIAKVIKDSAADRAGLRPGDVIVRINGQPIGKEDPIQKESYRIGEQLLVEYYRGTLLQRAQLRISELKSGGR
jgi:serine protease Do